MCLPGALAGPCQVGGSGQSCPKSSDARASAAVDEKVRYMNMSADPKKRFKQDVGAESGGGMIRDLNTISEIRGT